MPAAREYVFIADPGHQGACRHWATTLVGVMLDRYLEKPEAGAVLVLVPSRALLDKHVQNNGFLAGRGGTGLRAATSVLWIGRKADDP